MNLSSAIRLALRPVSPLYGGVAWARAWIYRKGILRQQRLPQIVLSVGNLTVGGTGKTPMVLWLVERLLTEGKRVAILSRGYAGLGNNANAGPRRSDEVSLLRERTEGQVPIGVGANRFAAALALEKERVEWFVLDDGFQHLQLARDVDLVLVDAMNPFGGGLLPAGRLREPLSALSRADIVVITRSVAAPDIVKELGRYTAAPVFYAQALLQSIVPVPGAPGALANLTAPGNRKFFSFCGIGNPSGFESDLKTRWGFHIAGARAFSDHHAYTTGDIRELERAAQAAGAEALVCTEKDVHNLPAPSVATLPAYFCRMALQINDADGLWRAILATVERRRAGGAR